MIRVWAIGLLLAAGVAVAACGGGGSNTTATPAATAAPSGSPTATPAVTPAATTAPPTPTPTSFAGNWTISGQINSGVLVEPNTCAVTGQSFQVTLRGRAPDGTAFGIIIGTDKSGTIDFGQASSAAVTIAVQYGGPGQAANNYWYAAAGDPGTSGTITLDAKGSGSIQLTVPPSPLAPAGATAPITLSGPWTCT